jgi:hypothetical protein
MYTLRGEVEKGQEEGCKEVNEVRRSSGEYDGSRGFRGAVWIRLRFLSARRSDVGQPVEPDIDGQSDLLAPPGALTA